MNGTNFSNELIITKGVAMPPVTSNEFDAKHNEKVKEINDWAKTGSAKKINELSCPDDIKEVQTLVIKEEIIKLKKIVKGLREELAELGKKISSKKKDKTSKKAVKKTTKKTVNKKATKLTKKAITKKISKKKK